MLDLSNSANNISSSSMLKGSLLRKDDFLSYSRFAKWFYFSAGFIEIDDFWGLDSTYDPVVAPPAPFIVALTSLLTLSYIYFINSMSFLA